FVKLCSSSLLLQSTSARFPYSTLFRSTVRVKKMAAGHFAPAVTSASAAVPATAMPTAKLLTPSTRPAKRWRAGACTFSRAVSTRSEEHTSELQSRFEIVCRLLLEKNNNLVDALRAVPTRVPYTAIAKFATCPIAATSGEIRQNTYSEAILVQ